MINGKTREWLTLHIFCHQHDQQEALLNQALFPAIEELKDQGHCNEWFYIRYWEGGPHTRMRFLNASPEVETTIRKVANQFMREMFPPKDPKKAPWNEQTEIITLPYEPEYMRYGGKLAMDISEKLFHQSSEMTVHVLRETVGNFEKRIIMAFDLMVITALCMAVEPERISEYFGQYALFWGEFIESKDELEKRKNLALQHKETLESRIHTLITLAEEPSKSSFYQKWVGQLYDARSSLEELARQGNLLDPHLGETFVDRKMFIKTISSIAFSHIHMTNNRLGIIPGYEYYLGTMIQSLAKEGRYAQAQ
ncbi:thiopeptide-type bacteriocin biosynthesis protein [Paenibacillus sp. KN14-4R]|uniref:thiopeptide-type bacteriocin biosynthesis protein n=1 Tax=Paenibacillus sp. KN14-4R TaxID=3445773 RepID=UPI003FA0AEF9